MTSPEQAELERRRGIRRYLALLRGVNVGGKNKLPMTDLAEIFTELGCSDVQTYIQSGNVVFSATPVLAKGIAPRVESAVLERFDITSPVVLRSVEEMEAVVAQNPFLGSGADEKQLCVAFLRARPAKRQAAALDPDRSPGDAFHLHGREIYLHLPNGAARTKLTNEYFDRVLATTCTVRNWRTTRRLADMAASRA
ncbi:MAG: DUF1697 domain-containing protein [Phycisphaerales bacterium JB038]